MSAVEALVLACVSGSFATRVSSMLDVPYFACEFNPVLAAKYGLPATTFTLLALCALEEVSHATNS